MRFLLAAIIALAVALLLLVMPLATLTRAAPLAFLFEVIVNTTADEYDATPNSTCSLREAIKSHNDKVSYGGCARTLVLSVGTDTILLPSGTYTLTRTGAGEDLDATGDLDIRQNVIISATGAAMPIVAGNAGWNDRIFHIVTGTVTFKGFAIRGGNLGAHGNGGGVKIESGQSLTFNDGEVRDNSADFGGGIANGGTATLTTVTFSSNSANVGGGIGIFNSGTATLTNVTLSGNSAQVGGGIANGGTATLTNATFSGNKHAANGGGFYHELGTTTLTNITFSGNSATSGGGFYNNSGTATLTNVTFSGNSATSGGGIYKLDGTIALTNTIVANSTGPNCNMSLGGSFNLSNDGTCSFGSERDFVGAMLAPLANNGGATLTHMLRPGSPAIDFGTNTGCPSMDQRGLPRPFNGTCDVGAVERQIRLYLPYILK